ncbi:hypothetical protein GMO_10000 [Gluconobacter morbifer G707]|uniref:Uncharacterized protein n=1 Tax=Gluconobacter morbifer G707 TaxID=1088869 RepID=G6XHN4_9PROT|nr:hypothetical protein GMO_10000 [Gluconobacter morbifer G707]
MSGWVESGPLLSDPGVHEAGYLTGGSALLSDCNVTSANVADRKGSSDLLFRT